MHESADPLIGGAGLSASCASHRDVAPVALSQQPPLQQPASPTQQPYPPPQAPSSYYGGVQAGDGARTRRRGLQTRRARALLAPIALYPDSLLAQMLMASTYPLEIVQADRWLKANKSLKGAALTAELEKQSWDASVKSLVNFPDVLAMMSEKLDLTIKIGDAFIAQQVDVMNTVQILRNKAQAQGNLKNQRAAEDHRRIAARGIRPSSSGGPHNAGYQDRAGPAGRDLRPIVFANRGVRRVGVSFVSARRRITRPGMWHRT